LDGKKKSSIVGGRWSVVGGRWSVVGWPTDSRQIPGLLGPIVFAMILLGLAFSGHFSPKQFSQM
jgi:hypothetical protein